MFEETGLKLDPGRFAIHENRQCVSTLSVHRAEVFSAELTEKEIAWFRSQAGTAHGVEEDTERTFVEVKTLNEVISENCADWVTLGAILRAVNRAADLL